MQLLPRGRAAGLLYILAGQLAASAALADSWLPVAPEDLQMTSLPQAPGAPAVYLYKQVDRDDNNNDESVYLRLKILTDEGRKYGNVEIRYVKGFESVGRIEARTLHPDGRIDTFNGAMYDKPLLEAHGAKYLAKAFDLPAVEPGCIVEYRYTRRINAYGWVWGSHWILSEDLFTREAKFSLIPNRYVSMRWSWPNGLPPGTVEPRKEKGRVLLEVHDVPAFVTEDYLPPEDTLRYRVDFTYVNDPHLEKDPVAFWTKFGKEAYHEVERFVDQRAAMQRAVAQVVQSDDSPEAKLRKIYARVQGLRNLSYERARSEEEKSSEGLKSARDVEDIWNHGYGTQEQLTWLFVALARAAGLPADAAHGSSRDRYLFDPRLMNFSQLNIPLAVVALGGRDLYLSPAVPYTPFGLVPWWATDVRVLRLTAAGGTWTTTPLPDASASRIEHKAALKLSSGTLDGKLIVRFTGLEASWRRLAERDEDDTARREFLEREVEGSVPTGVNVKLTNQPAWSDSESELVAEYDLQIPGWAQGAGRRQLLPVGVFSNGERHTFEHTGRVHQIYFDFPYQHDDDVTIEVPAGWRVVSVPQAHTLDLKGIAYKISTEGAPQSLHLTRQVALSLYRTDVKSYESLQKFFQFVRTADEEQALVAPNTGAPH